MSKLIAKYGIGDEVWKLHTYRDRVGIDCTVCGGSGEVGVAGHDDLTAHCPVRECRWGQVFPASETLYADIRLLTIGKIEVIVEAHEPDGIRPLTTEVRYMAWETGVGSGTNHREKDLYDSREDAEAAAFAVGAVVRAEVSA